MNLWTSTQSSHLSYTVSTSNISFSILLPGARRWAPQELRICASDSCNSFWMRCISKLPPAPERSLLLATDTNARHSLTIRCAFFRSVWIILVSLISHTESITHWKVLSLLIVITLYYIAKYLPYPRARWGTREIYRALLLNHVFL